ncbi:MAG TPA: cell division protein FtsA [Patescibacteria group bacterium]|nr:cell division protein FtsA [Patescibacteria group bacterium]
MGKNTKQTKVGVDIGNTRTVTIVMSSDHETGDLTVLGYSNVAQNGMRKGMVVDIDETIASIAQSLEEAERMSGIPIERALVSIGGGQTSSANSRGVVAVSSPSGEIGKDDIMRVIDAAKAFSMPANREVIHVIPRSFIVDGQDAIKDPIGMKGIRLEVDSHVITASSPVVKNLLKCAYQAGIDVEEMVLSSLAASRTVLTRKQKEIGVVLVDIGGGGTNIAVFEEGEILHTAFIPVGASHVTNDIAIGLKTSIEFAEKVKVEYGAATTNRVSEKDTIDLSEIDPSIDKGLISRKYIVEIINARLEELFMMVKDELRKINRDGLLPAGAILTGGGSKIEDIVEVARESLRLPVQLGKTNDSIVSIDKETIDNPSFSTAIGLALWGFDLAREQGGMKNIIEGFRGSMKILGKIKNVFKKR